MNVFDILGPVMIGPSSSHTAGAARIGLMARTLLGQAPVRGRDPAPRLLRQNLQGPRHRPRPGRRHSRHEARRRTPARRPVHCPRGRGGDHLHADRICRQPSQHSRDPSHSRRRQHSQPRGASVGGGRIEVVQIDGMPVSLTGEYFTSSSSTKTPQAPSPRSPASSPTTPATSATSIFRARPAAAKPS